MKHLILFSFFLFWGLTLSAQLTPAELVVKVNAHYQSVQRGHYTYRIKSLYLMDSDTFFRHGEVFYYKTNNRTDTIALFYHLYRDTVFNAFDGERYISILHNKKKIRAQNVSEWGGVTDFFKIRKKFEPTEPLLIPALTNTGHIPLPADRWDKYTLSTENGKYLLTRKGVEPMKQKIAPNADSVRFTTIWTIDAVTLDIIKYEDFVDVGIPSKQYDEAVYSRIDILPSTSSLEDHYNETALLQQGYELTEVPNKQSSPKPQVAVGDTVMDFRFWTGSGDMTSLLTMSEARYMVLDFWYKNCGPCNIAMPDMDRLVRAYSSKNIGFVALNCRDKDYQKVLNLYAPYNYAIPMRFADQSVLEQVKVTVFPTVLVVDRQEKKVVYTQRGTAEKHEQLEMFLKELR
jgi:thiol-disulfide isomerase/thioredoxin